MREPAAGSYLPRGIPLPKQPRPSALSPPLAVHHPKRICTRGTVEYDLGDVDKADRDILGEESDTDLYRPEPTHLESESGEEEEPAQYNRRGARPQDQPDTMAYQLLPDSIEEMDELLAQERLKEITVVPFDRLIEELQYKLADHPRQEKELDYTIRELLVMKANSIDKTIDALDLFRITTENLVAAAMKKTPRKRKNSHSANGGSFGGSPKERLHGQDDLEPARRKSWTGVTRQGRSGGPPKDSTKISKCETITKPPLEGTATSKQQTAP